MKYHFGSHYIAIFAYEIIAFSGEALSHDII